MQTPSPKQISPRVSFQKTKQECKIVISQQVEKWKETLLFTWIIAWSFCGLVFLNYWMQSSVQSERIFLTICIAFWAFFLVRIGKVYLWRRKGFEQIIFLPGSIEIKNGFGKRGKVETYDLGKIRNFGIIKTNEQSFLQSMDNSFWVMGGERFGFDFNGRKIRFGKQLNEKETTTLGRIMDKSLREFAK